MTYVALRTLQPARPVVLHLVKSHYDLQHQSIGRGGRLQGKQD